MVEENLIQQGVELMVYGMGTVVIFLTLLVGATSLMSALVERFSPAVPEPASGEAAPVADKTLVAVISAAIHKHRSRHDS
jgi:oxaloacetate decarboxylase gamma subunit